MSAESPTVGIWNTCKVCTETLRDTLSSSTTLSLKSAMVTDLQIHQTPEGPFDLPCICVMCNVICVLERSTSQVVDVRN